MLHMTYTGRVQSHFKRSTNERSTKGCRDTSTEPNETQRPCLPQVGHGRSHRRPLRPRPVPRIRGMDCQKECIVTVLLEEVFENLNEPMPDFEMVVEAANALYMAGRWSLENPQFGAPCEEHQIALWEDLRDALGFLPGHSTSAGVNSLSVESGSANQAIPSEVEIQSIPGVVRAPIVECPTADPNVIFYLLPFQQQPKEPTDIEKLCHRLDVMISHLEDIAENTESL